MSRAQRFIPSLVVAAVLLSTGVARPQPFPFPAPPRDTTTIEKMRSGTVDFDSNVKTHEELLQQYAKWFAHRLVHPPFNGMEPAKKSFSNENLETLISDMEKALLWPNPRLPANDFQIKYAFHFAKALEYEIMDVYEKAEKPLEKVNAVRMFATVGKAPNAALADTYLKIIRDGKYGLEIKLFAFQGLHNFLAISNPLDPKEHFFADARRNAAKWAEIAQEIEKFIIQKHPANLPVEQARVIQFVRREAVRALAQIKSQIIRQGVAMVLDKPLWTLLRVASNDKIVKPADAAMPGHGFTMPERIEAIVGILSMKPDREVNQDVVAYIVNDALIEIGAFHTLERANLGNDARNRPLVPWKITGVHLMDAFKTWQTSMSLPGLRGAAEGKRFTDKALELKCIPKLEDQGIMAVADFRAFDDWKRDRKPKSTQVLDGDDTTTVDFGK